MSRNNAKLTKIIDLQCKVNDAILTKRDFELIITGLRNIDTSTYTNRRKEELKNLLNYFSEIAYRKL